nr:hypothetical protein [Endozoicomonas sp.]
MGLNFTASPEIAGFIPKTAPHRMPDQKMPDKKDAVGQSRTVSSRAPKPTVNLAAQGSGKSQPSLAERIILIIDDGLMGPGKMTPVNMARTAHKVLESSLVTAATTVATKYGFGLNSTAAAVTGNLGSAWVKSTNPFALINMAVTALHHGPGITSAVCGENSTSVSFAKHAADATRFAVILEPIYNAITAGSLTTATKLLSQFGARYGAHS